MSVTKLVYAWVSTKATGDVQLGATLSIGSVTAETVTFSVTTP
jgi:hypothetical protein